MKNSIERTRPFKIALIYKRMYKSKRARRRLNFGIFRCFFAIKMGREARKKRKKRKKGGSNSRKAQRILNDVYENGGVEEVLQTIHELARVGSCHSRCSFPRLSTLFFPLNDNLLTRLSAFFHGHSSKADENRTRSPHSCRRN